MRHHPSLSPANSPPRQRLSSTRGGANALSRVADLFTLGLICMKLVIPSFAFLLLLQVASASDAPERFPLLGCWRTVSYAKEHGKFQKVTGFFEEQFSKDGRWVCHIGDGGYADGDYTFRPPDGFEIRYNYGDSAPTQRFKFHLDGNVVTVTAFPLHNEFSVGPTNWIKSQSAEPKIFRMHRVKKLTFAPGPKQSASPSTLKGPNRKSIALTGGGKVGGASMLCGVEQARE
jgi:hypothetical protein